MVQVKHSSSTADVSRISGRIHREYLSAPEIAYRTLRDEILSGRLGSGTKMRQAELAEMLGFSCVPIREALKRLEGEGLVTLRPQRGYFVTSLDVDEIREIFEIRMLLEERAGYYATLGRSQQDIAKLAEILSSMRNLKATDPSRVSKWAGYNRAFHDCLFQPSQRAHLCRLSEQLRNSVEGYIRIDATMSGRISEAAAEHDKIFEAFRHGDAERVGELSRLHCQHTCDALVASLDLQASKETEVSSTKRT